MGYFDESGTHDGSTSVAVGGFVGPEKRWRRFEREWALELRDEGVPYMHMSELESCRGLFASWDTTRARHFQKRLLAIIRKHCAWGVSCTVILDDYERLVLGHSDEELPKKVGTPFGVCSLGCINLAVEWLKKKHPGESITCVFESGGPTGELTDWFARQKRLSPGLADLSFGAKKDVLPLQAADVHAYEAWKHTENQFVPENPVRDVRKSLESLFDMPMSGRSWDASGLQRLIDEVRDSTEY